MTRKRLREKGYKALAAVDLPLARALGVALVHATGKVRMGETTSPWWVSGIQAKIISAAVFAARAAGTDPVTFVESVYLGRYVQAVQQETRRHWPLQYNLSLASVLGVPIALGSLRCHPDGRIEVWDGATWAILTEEQIRALDAEARLGGRVSVLQQAASMLLEAFDNRVQEN